MSVEKKFGGKKEIPAAFIQQVKSDLKHSEFNRKIQQLTIF
jgi:uncharacterized protein YecA (UPF0149 family)